MPIIDNIDRRGLYDRFVLAGPVQLKRPRSRGTRVGVAAAFGLADVFDEYEIGVGSTGTAAGTYIVTVYPRSRMGHKPRMNGVGRVILATRVNGIAVPTNPITKLADVTSRQSERPLILPSRVAAAGDQLWVIINLTASSTARYSLSVDFT